MLRVEEDVERRPVKCQRRRTATVCSEPAEMATT
jgi:hypothetical protein